MTGRCPRCTGRMPVRTLLPAQSKTDGKTVICGPCSRVERMQLEFSLPLIPPADWPVGTDIPAVSR